jgi:hypothetical protein
MADSPGEVVARSAAVAEGGEVVGRVGGFGSGSGKLEVIMDNRRFWGSGNRMNFPIENLVMLVY